jgi:hypothetical protein
LLGLWDTDSAREQARAPHAQPLSALMTLFAELVLACSTVA